MNGNFQQRRWTLRLALFAGVALACLGATSARAQADTFTESVQVPFNVPYFVPCADGGAGEVVTLTGTLHTLFHGTIDASGGIHVMLHVNPQDISGVGSTTGDQYRGTGMDMEEYNLTVGVQDTFVQNFRIIGPGRGNNLLVHTNMHIVIDANGDVIVYFDNTSIDCK